MRRALRAVVTLSFVLYAVMLLALPVLWWRFGERHWPLILLCYAPPVFYLFPLIPLVCGATLLKERLSGYQSARGGDRGELLSLSRYPIVSSQEHDLDGYSQCLEIVVDAQGRKLRFLNVHVLTGDPKGVLKGKAKQRSDYLKVSAQSRHHQTKALRAVLAQSGMPTILVGDFNSPPGSTLHKSLAEVMQDSWAKKGLGFGMTYKSNAPLWRIDYLWVTPDLGVESCHVINSRLSDHKPLAGSYRW